MKKPLKIALIGYGKMGKEIEKILIERGHIISTIIDSKTNLQKILDSKCDVAIEFTQPESALSNIAFCVSQQIPLIVGTTGWYQEFDNVRNLVNQHQSSLFTATNFSIGVNLFFHLNKKLAAIMNHYPEYHVTIEETHHKQKKDAPSGTAITTAENILSNYNSKDSWISIENGKYLDVAANEIPIYSFREDNVPGVHKVKWDCDIDEIEITHSAHNRRGFALGAVLAAEWIIGRKGIFGMNDMLGFE